MRFVLVAALFLVACVPSTQSVASSTRPSPAAAQTPSALGNCRLPVRVSDAPSSVGWLELPSGRYSPDPTSVGHVSSYNDMTAWDPAVGGWVPTDSQSVSPDGTHYVAPINAATVDIVDARTGATVSEVPTHNATINTVIGYTQTAIYLVATGESPPPGLWKIETSSWKLSHVSSERVDWGSRRRGSYLGDLHHA